MTSQDFFKAADFIRRYIAAVESHLFRAKGIQWAYEEMAAAESMIKLLEARAADDMAKLVEKEVANITKEP